MPELTANRPLHVCDCGQVNEPAADRIATLEQQVRVLQENEANLTAELVSKLAQVKRLKREQDAQRKTDPRYADAIDRAPSLADRRATRRPRS